METHSQRIDTLVTDIVCASWDASGETWGASGPSEPLPEGAPTITMSPRVRHAANLLREFMFQEVYLPLGKSEESEVAREIIRVLFRHFVKHPEQIPQAYFRHEENENQAVVDYLSGMTDHYAIRQAESLQPGISRGVFSRVPLV